MAYNIPCGSSQPPFFNDNMANSQFFHQDDLMDIQSCWVDKIDPFLRNQNQESQQSWQSQQQPIQRYIEHPERAFFTAPSFPNPTQAFLRGVPRPSIPISTLPQAPHARMVSPTPSHDLTSTCSSDRSPGGPGGPGGDNEWYQDPSYYSPPSQDDFNLSNTTPQLSQGFPLWSGQQQEAFPQLGSFDCVNLSQVQGFADPDPQEVMFDADEGYDEMEMKTEYTIEVCTQNIKTEEGHQTYRYPSDEGIGASIKDEGSPHNTTIHVDTGNVSDIDAEGDAEDVIIAEPASDTEYSPKSSRSRKRRASKVTFQPSPKRGRIVKSLPKSKGNLACKACDHAPFKDQSTLQRHIASSHTRAFVCVFDFAGCQSTFASKNEWKRHVSSQHLNLHAWVCEMGPCAKVQSRHSSDGESALKGSEFNRKDLFTQHLRRMHAPHAVKRMNKKNPEWEERLKELQISCLRVKRQPPSRLACPLDICNGVFEGSTCWDERMEHVGKHLEKADSSFGKEKFVVEQVDDELLVGWALREGIIEKRVNGGFRLCGTGAGRGDDEDGECEEE